MRSHLGSASARTGSTALTVTSAGSQQLPIGGGDWIEVWENGNHSAAAGLDIQSSR